MFHGPGRSVPACFFPAVPFLYSISCFTSQPLRFRSCYDFNVCRAVLTFKLEQRMRTATRILVSGTFIVSAIVGSSVQAQRAPAQTTRTAQNHAAPSPSHSAVESNPACQRIIAECKKLGYIPGQWKKDNGLWRDCFDPVVKGGNPTRDGKPMNVPVSPSDVQACRAAEGRK